MEKRGCYYFSAAIIIFILLILRVFSINSEDKYLQAGISQSTYSLSFDKTRGEIYDCNMVPLVEQERQMISAIVPTKENEKLVKNCSIYPSKQAIIEGYKNNKPFLQNVDRVATIPQVEFIEASKRYSQNQIAQHLIGYVNGDNEGVCGIERAFNDKLNKSSDKSLIKFSLDGLSNIMPQENPRISYAPILTEGVVLTIDEKIQKLCEKVGAKNIAKGAIVVQNPTTGKLLAVASFPNYNANNLQDAIADKQNSPMLNRAFCAYNVGSVFKPVSAAAALSAKIEGVSFNTKYNCVGKIDICDNVFGCHKKAGHGVLDLQGAMAASCNPYFINFCKDVNPQTLLNTASDLSFGKSTKLCEGLYSAKGNLPTLKELSMPAGKANFSFGQGSLTATPVQISQMLSAVVNDGKLIPAKIVEGYFDGKNLIREKSPFPVNAIPKEIANMLTKDLIYSVNDVEGQNAKAKYFTCGGKTGTAQTGQFSNGQELLQGFFAGFLYGDSFLAKIPVEQKIATQKPKYVIVVLCENAKSGNADASPVFSEIAEELSKLTY